MKFKHESSLERLKRLEKNLFEIFEKHPQKSDSLKIQLKEIERNNFNAGIKVGIRLATMGNKN